MSIYPSNYLSTKLPIYPHNYLSIYPPHYLSISRYHAIRCCKLHLLQVAYPGVSKIYFLVSSMASKPINIQ